MISTSWVRQQTAQLYSAAKRRLLRASESSVEHNVDALRKCDQTMKLHLAGKWVADDVLVECLRSIAELVVWGDQHDHVVFG